MNRITVRLGELSEMVEAEAHSTGRSRSDVVRDLIQCGLMWKDMIGSGVHRMITIGIGDQSISPMELRQLLQAIRGQPVDGYK